MSMSIDLASLVKGTTIVHLPTGTGHVLRDRKLDGSGWWLFDGGGVADKVLSSGTYATTDALVAEVERLRSVPEPDNHHNAYACPHCEAPIHAVEAERDRYRAEWEEAARHALRWQAEYDTAQQEVERLRDDAERLREAIACQIEGALAGPSAVHPEDVSYMAGLTAAARIARGAAVRAALRGPETSGAEPRCSGCGHGRHVHRCRHLDCDCTYVVLRGDAS